MIIPPIDLRIVDGVASGRGTMHAHWTLALRVIITDAARSSARVFWNPAEVIQTDKDGMTSRDRNTSIRYPNLKSPVLIGSVTTFSLSRTGR